MQILESCSPENWRWQANRWLVCNIMEAMYRGRSGRLEKTNQNHSNMVYWHLLRHRIWHFLQPHNPPSPNNGPPPRAPFRNPSFLLHSLHPFSYKHLNLHHRQFPPPYMAKSDSQIFDTPPADWNRPRHQHPYHGRVCPNRNKTAPRGPNPSTHGPTGRLGCAHVSSVARAANSYGHWRGISFPGNNCTVLSRISKVAKKHFHCYGVVVDRNWALSKHGNYRFDR